ncbi:MAG TPA: adenosine deaminase, partial [Acidobacteriaceae bacterium]
MLRALHRSLCCAGMLLVAVLPVRAQRAAVPAGPSARASRAFAQAQSEGPLALRAFLVRMPKGADLHVHLSGAVYAETFLREAEEDGLCISPATLSVVRKEKTDPQAVACGAGEVPATSVHKDQQLYDRLIDSFSMRTFVPVTGESGHDHFFATFDRFGGVGKQHMGEWLDEVASRAAAQNEQYLELMDTPDYKPAAALAEKIGYEVDLPRYRQDMLTAGLRSGLTPIAKTLDRAEADRRAREHCDSAAPLAGCEVEVRYLVQVLRGISPETDFAQILRGFELA